MNTHDDGRMSRMPEPWELEQDEYSFMASGLQCLLLRNDVTLTWSGLAEIRLVRYLHPAQCGAMDRALRRSFGSPCCESFLGTPPCGASHIFERFHTRPGTLRI